MNIYRNNINKKLYILEWLVKDIKFANNNAFHGIYAYPYKHVDDDLKCIGDAKECNKFIEDNFTYVFTI